MSDLLPSISYSQHDIIRWITALHLGGHRIELDPTYGHGSFYSPADIMQPILAYDNNPQLNRKVLIKDQKLVLFGDATNLPHPDNSISSIMFDPPFLCKTGEGSIIKDRFGTYPSMNKLWKFYAEALFEFARLLKPNGVLIVKCMNTVMSGKQWWSVNYTRNLASEYGLDMVDEFVLLSKHKMGQHNLRKQRHARKYHSYFLVFRKGK